MADELEDRVKRLEYGMWGLRGDNGLVVEVRELRREFRDFVDGEATRRKDESKEAERRREVETREKKIERRWNITTSIAIIGAIIGAASIIAAAL